MTKRRSKSVSTQLFHAEITGLSHEGRGIASINGKVTFLFGGLPNETTEFIYLKTHGKYDEGKVVSVFKESPLRTKPDCIYFGTCGGCCLQHMQPNAQILAKQHMLLEHLTHIAGVQPEKVFDPLISPTQGYRHKARLGVKHVLAKDKVLVGFREMNGRYIADMQSCSILHPSVGQKLNLLGDLIYGLDASQSIPQIEVAVGEEAAALIFRHLQPLNTDDLEKISTFAEAQGFHIYLQPGGPETIHKLWPEDNNNYLTYSLPEQNIIQRFHPSDFTQVNPALNRQMVKLALSLLKLKPQERVLDLFCGLGNFTLPLAKHCLEVIGVEGESRLVDRAKVNATHNHITNTSFYSHDLTQNFLKSSWALSGFDKILLDPPRTGALEVIKQLSSLRPNMILYISCNPTTFARDAKELIQQGYRLTQAGVMDMFPHTSHVESMALFEL